MTDTNLSWTSHVRTLSIRTKLTLVSGLVVLALVAIPLLSWQRDISIRAMNDTRLNILSLERMVLGLQRSQNDFINLYAPKFREEFSLTFETFVERTWDLKQQYWDLNLPIDTLEELVVHTSDYQYLFEVMAELQMEIGQDTNHGIRGRIADHVAHIEALLQTVPNTDNARSALLRHIAMMQLPAQTVLSEYSVERINAFEQHYQQMIRDSETLIADPALRAELLDAIADYHLTFLELVDAIKRIGVTYDDGLHGLVAKAVNATKAALAKMNDELEAAITTRQRELNTALAVAAGFFFIAFIMSVVMFFRSIATPIRGVTSIMTRLADGDLKVAIPDQPRRDEIGDMFRALRVFKMGAVIRRRTQEELRKAHDELEQRVEERTRALSEEIQERRRAETDLRHARELAEGANRAKSQFLANMSHELRTPLNAIIGYGEMLREDAEDAGDERACDDLGKILSASRHLLTLINEILDLAKIEAGRVDVNIEPFSVEDLIHTVANTVKPLIASNENTLQIEIGDTVGIMESDIMRLRQILYNFLSNAAKFTEHGTITLTCTSDGKTNTFAVTDTGIGITEEQIKHVFEPFAQADASTTRRYGGTGLGLTVNREFARLLGGEVVVHSRHGKGTTFSVCLPVTAPSDPVGTEAGISS